MTTDPQGAPSTRPLTFSPYIELGGPWYFARIVGMV
ncbi:hypothetical protein ABH944_003720 [Caballeronia udeis]|jgi:hypothetical protein|uniref:Uncharacterized protein n=1 Tax=Caballeronia udeis TaxID=1232866 RepID=A0ABW8MI37_9BURK